MVPLGAQAERAALGIANQLRRDGFAVELTYRGNLSKRMKRANQAGAIAAVIMGEDEIERDVVTVRNLETGDQTEIARAELTGYLARYSGAR
jgi:histidyl-tRNA synthetase